VRRLKGSPLRGEGGDIELRQAVEAALDDEAGGFDKALALIREELQVDRISLHAVNGEDESFRVVAGVGDDILAPGTELPLETSTQVRVPAAGGIFRGSALDEDSSFDHALDQLVTDMGFRSGCSVPLVIGSRAFGVVCVTSRSAEVASDRLIDVLNEVSPSLTLALHAAAEGDLTRIMVCHEDLLLGEGIARILENALAAEIEVCTTPDVALARVEDGVARIDTVVCDSFFADGRVHTFLRELRTAGAAAPAVVVASHDSPLSHHLAMRSGAAGYVKRSDGPGGLVSVVRDVASGRPVRLVPRPGDGAHDDGPDAHLTPQEAKVLLLLERGLRFKQIALEMDISESTAKGYARNVFAKLNVNSRGEAVHEARRQGVLEFLRSGARSAPLSPASD
jgi:DNA-binding NarL/FixJ family response regulator